jgi:hypothetical protein
MGCIIDLALIVLAFVFPWTLVFLFPYWIYQFVMRLREYRYLKIMDDFSGRELKSMTPEEIEEKRAHTPIKRIRLESDVRVPKIYADTDDFAESCTLNWIENILIILFLLMSLYMFVSEILE